MNSSTSILNVSEMMTVLMRATGDHVHARIPTIKSKKAYENALKRAIAFSRVGFESVDLLKTKIESIREDAVLIFPKKMFDKREDEVRHFNLAVDQALEIVQNIHARFVTGASDSAPRTFKDKGQIYLDKSVFE